MPDRAYLYPIDPELNPGARNAINVCLRLKPQERITIITDAATREIAAALQFTVQAALDRWLGDLVEVRSLDVASEDGRLTVDLCYAVRRTGAVVETSFERAAP